jgi:hypothetical protein
MTDSEDTIASSLLLEVESIWKGEGGMAMLQTDTQSIKLIQEYHYSVYTTCTMQST